MKFISHHSVSHIFLRTYCIQDHMTCWTLPILLSDDPGNIVDNESKSRTPSLLSAICPSRWVAWLRFHNRTHALITGLQAGVGGWRGWWCWDDVGEGLFGWSWVISEPTAEVCSDLLLHQWIVINAPATGWFIIRTPHITDLCGVISISETSL